ncbi:MAG: class I SAM-dependent methyltransferase [Pseudomonadota bacterium]
MTQAAHFWNRIAHRYAAKPIADPDAYEATLARTAHYLGTEDEVLELGCGTGGTALRLAPSVRHYTATDIAPLMIDIARDKLAERPIPNLTLAVAEPGADLLWGRRFDVVLAFNLFHLLPDPAAGLKQSCDLLRPGGYLVTKTPCLGGLGVRSAGYRIMVGGMKALGFAPHVSFLNQRTWPAQIRATGFDIVERGSHPMGSYNRFVVARRPE